MSVAIASYWDGQISVVSDGQLTWPKSGEIPSSEYRKMAVSDKERVIVCFVGHPCIIRSAERAIETWGSTLSVDDFVYNICEDADRTVDGNSRAGGGEPVAAEGLMLYQEKLWSIQSRGVIQEIEEGGVATVGSGGEVAKAFYEGLQNTRSIRLDEEVALASAVQYACRVNVFCGGSLSRATADMRDPKLKYWVNCRFVERCEEGEEGKEGEKEESLPDCF